MEIESIIAILKELTLDFVNHKKNREETVIALHERIKPEEIDQISDSSAQKPFIEEVYYSLDNLTTEDFAPSMEELQYFADCFEGQRTFSREEARQFPVGPFAREDKPRQKTSGSTSRNRTRTRKPSFRSPKPQK